MISTTLKSLFAVLCCGLTIPVIAQNLVPNGGFEANDYGQVREWKQPIEDYYHYEVRTTYADSEMVYNAINGLCLLQPAPSEFLVAKLKTPLQPGKRYCLSLNMYYGNTFIGKFDYLKSIEVAFSDTAIEVWKRTKLFLTPKITIPVIREDHDLKQPSPVEFEADGTEEYIVIGKFHSLIGTISFEEKRTAIWREQYYAADSIKKYYLRLLPPPKDHYEKRESKREIRKLKDSLDKIEMAKIDAIHANASFYQQKVAQLTYSPDTSSFHVRVYLDNICVAPVLKSGECICNETEQKPFEIGRTYRLNNIQFDLDKASFKPQSYAEMDNLIRVLRKYPKMVIQLNGHTDNLNSESYNKDLSNRRAKAVYDYIAGKGISNKRLTWKGFGETKPITDNTTEEARAVNRRVEFLVIKVE
ncbi:MAG: OmpA family protein [Bacteroidota bacterium]